MVRAFIAIELPASIQKAIEHFILDDLQSEFSSDIVRWIPVKNIHLTLHFLGDIHEERIEAVKGLLKKAAEGTAAFDLAIRGLGFFPRARTPRVIWLGLDEQGEQLKHLHTELRILLSKNHFTTESRPFHPHLTLGRVKRTARPNQIATLADHLESIKPPEIGVFPVGTVHLIRSDLRPHGAEYSCLASAYLGASQ